VREKISVMLMLRPAAVIASMAAIPASVAGDLDHQVGPVDPLVQVPGGVDGGGGVIGDLRGHLYGDEPVASATGFVERREQVGGPGYVGDDQFPVGVFEGRAGLEKPVELLGVGVGAAHGVGEDARVRRDPPNPGVDEILEGTVLEAIPGQIVQPRALAVLGVQPMKTCHRFTLRGVR
jgi:hypothetical protein